MSNRKQRLDRLAASSERRDRRWDTLAYHHRTGRHSILVARFVRDGLMRLGFPAERAATISRIDAVHARVAELKPLPPDYVERPLPSTEQGRAAVARLNRLIERFSDPAEPVPDFDAEPGAVALAYVLARAPRDAPPPTPSEPASEAAACDVAPTSGV